MEEEKLSESEIKEKEYEADLKAGLYQPEENPESEGETIRKGGAAYGALTVLMFSIIAFILIGLSLDSYLQKSPLFTVGGIIFGSMIGFYQFIRMAK